MAERGVTELGEVVVRDVPPPPEDTINEAGVLAELRNKGAIDIGQVSTTPIGDKWYYSSGILKYKSRTPSLAILNISTRNPPTESNDIKLEVKGHEVNELSREWVMAQLAKLPYGAAPPPPPTPPPPTPPPPPPPEGLKGWIDGVDVHKLTKDYAKYIWFVSRGRTSDENELRNRLSPKPAEMPTEAATRTNAKGVWFYSRGQFTYGNELLGFNYS